MFYSTIVTVALVCIIPSVYSYSAGAPETACVDMTPQHHTDPQPSEPPYKLILSNDKLRADKSESVDLKIQGNGAGNTIKGFMIQARVDGKPVGNFTVKSKKHAQLLNCFGGSGVSKFIQKSFFHCNC